MNVGVSGLTLTGGDETLGGGIYNEGTLPLTGVVVAGNHATFGGGIYHAGGALRLRDCLVQGNLADDDGGGVKVVTGSEVTVLRSTVSGTQAGNDGGGLDVAEPRVVLTVANSTVSGNRAGE